MEQQQNLLAKCYIMKSISRQSRIFAFDAKLISYQNTLRADVAALQLS